VSGIIESLQGPDRNRRLEQVFEARSHSFQWAFDNSDISFSKWLRTGTGIFWISGKPGSGKSTLMKHIYNDPRTMELISQWGLQSRQMVATFFFHHRGNAMQKSFEGLLRGIISQALKSEPDLATIVKDMLVQEYIDCVNNAKLGDLRSDLMAKFPDCGLHYNDEVDRLVEAIMDTLGPRAQLRRIFADAVGEMTVDKQAKFEKALLLQKDALLLARNNGERVLREAIMDLWSAPNFPLQYTANVVPLTKSWLDAVDLASHITKLLESRGLAPSSAMDVTVNYIVSRQKRRDATLETIQEKKWRRKDLETILSKLLAQDQMDLQLTLFLDALDEYDGNPDFIATFLSSLINNAHRRTQVRICFSSRPWDAFIQEFGGCPGFKIHDHTEGDIHAYCMDIISSQRPEAITSLAELLPDIVRRAQGVFLWVRLVLEDLTRAVDAGQVLASELQKVLDSLPDELDDYYDTIVNRIPKSSRWDAYVLLECASRSRWELEIETAYRALELSRTSNFLDATKVDLKHRKQIAQLKKDGQPRDLFLRRVTALSGGLVETVQPGEETILQFMHQTAKEFAQHPTFKHKILGDWAKVVHENGNSFLSKAYFIDASSKTSSKVLSKIGWRVMGHYARAAELTTGKSQYAFLSEMDPHYLPSQMKGGKTIITWEPSMLHSAIFYGLNLYLNDAFTRNPLLPLDAESTPFAPLLSALDGSDLPEEQLLETTRLIMSHGCCPTMSDLDFLFNRNGNGLSPLTVVTSAYA